MKTFREGFVPLAFGIRLFSLLSACLGATTIGYGAHSAVLSGLIRHPQERVVTISWKPDPLTTAPQTKTATVNTAGYFRLTLPMANGLSVEVILGHGDNETRLFLRPGDDLVLNADASDFDATLRYSGTGSSANTCLAQLGRRFPSSPGDLSEDEMQSLTTRRFRQLAEDHRRRKLQYWATYAKAHPNLTADFRAYVHRTIAFEWAAALLSYAVPPAGPPRRFGPVSQTTADTTFRFLNQLVLPAPDAALQETAYLGFLASYAVARLRPLDDTARWVRPFTGEQVQNLYQRARQAFGQSRSRDVVVGLALYRQLLSIDVGSFAPQWAVFQQENRDSLVARSLGQAYRQRLPLAAGQQAPMFALRDSTGQLMRLSDWQGKVVYLEFWASWCAPCVAEIPALAPLKQRFAGQEVVFVYVSIDENPQAWRAALRRYPALGGATSVHVRDAGFNAPTVQAYQLAGVPAYWVIGRDGRILQGNAPRPSTGQATIDLLSRALRK